MKKLGLLKPLLKSGYLNGGRGQEVNYLDINGEIGMTTLKNDVKNGAAQFKELAEFAAKKPSRFVVINCNNKEEGLMAVTYLANIYNHLEGYSDVDEYYEELEENPDFFFEFDEEEEEGSWEEQSQWEESPYKMPVIPFNQLGSSDSMHNIFSGPFDYGAAYDPNRQQPYFNYTRSQPICIVLDQTDGYYIGNAEHVIDRFKRYNNNRHVFLVLVTDAEQKREDEDDEFDDPFCPDNKQAICEIILEYAAGTVSVGADKEAHKKYYEALLENWVQEYSYKLAKGFPKAKVACRITTMQNKDKSQLIEKVIRYVTKDWGGKEKVLEEKDFGILDKFKELGMEIGEEGSKTSRKVDQELVGMETVKEQMRGIVEIMRYNLRRKEMGLPSSYHNIHMLLGAPGTAKTTMAQMLGNMMKEEKLLKGNRFISINGAELKGMYVGHSAPKVKKLFEQNDIILIDEAYAVCAETNGSMDAFSQEAIAQLIIELENHGMDKLVMFAGYGGKNVKEQDNKMKQFLQANPGIRSRINSTILFESYTAEEMVKIFHNHAERNQYQLEEGCDGIVCAFFEKRVNESDFGNGREARVLLENTTVEAAKRLSKIPTEKISKKMLQELKVEDVEKAIARIQSGYESQKGNVASLCGFAV